MKDTVGQSEHVIGLWIKGRWMTVYTTRQVAQDLNYDEHYISQLCNQGKLIAYKVGTQWLIPPQRYRNISIDLIPF